MLNVVISKGLANFAGNHRENIYAARKGRTGKTPAVDVLAKLGGYVFMNV